MRPPLSLPSLWLLTSLGCTHIRSGIRRFLHLSVGVYTSLLVFSHLLHLTPLCWCFHMCEHPCMVNTLRPPLSPTKVLLTSHGCFQARVLLLIYTMQAHLLNSELLIFYSIIHFSRFDLGKPFLQSRHTLDSTGHTDIF